MIARSAIIKPWIFEEIESRQHIDKSATERLEMLKQFAHWGLEHWVGPSKLRGLLVGFRCIRSIENEKILLRIHEFLSSICAAWDSGS
jgi:hypothetical protein